jgi:aminoglycoside phosphotransferase (APT) family kinase protein
MTILFFFIIELLSKLNRDKKLKTVDEEAISRIKKALAHTEVINLVHGKCTLLHGDFKCDNILIRPNGSLSIIDWQSILFGPEEIDIYHMIATQDIDPVPIAGIGPEILRSALIIKGNNNCKRQSYEPEARAIGMGWLTKEQIERTR